MFLDGFRPQYPDNIWKREKWRNGIFLNCYSLQLYYMGYGGNHNSTTRFRRYDGNEAAVTNAKARPAILKEYTDADHLLEANKWYHIKITNENNRVSYYINGVRLVDFRDAEPLRKVGLAFVPPCPELVSPIFIMNVRRRKLLKYHYTGSVILRSKTKR